MNTRCLIAIAKDGCPFVAMGIWHRPGRWPDPASYYTTEQLAARLIVLGDLSYLQTDKAHTYHRGHGDAWAQTQPRRSTSESQLLALAGAYVTPNICTSFRLRVGYLGSLPSEIIKLTNWQRLAKVDNRSTGVTMHVISKRPFNEAARDYPNQKQAIEDLYQVLKKGEFASPDEMRRVFPSLDNFKYKDKWWVIDIGGNNLRMIAFIQFVQNRMYVKHIVTHAEYDKLCKRYARGELK